MAVIARKKRKAIALIGIYFLLKRREAINKRKLWRKPLRCMTNMMKELEVDGGSFRNYLRLTKDQFDDILARVQPFIERSNTNFRAAISPGERLAVTLRFLAGS